MIGVLALGIVAILGAIATPAEAARRLALGTFGPTAQPSFSGATALTVDSNGLIYVVDTAAKTIERFNPNGTPAKFSALGTNRIDGVAGPDQTPQHELSFFPGFEYASSLTQIAVDESKGATQGDIYVTQGGEIHAIDIFGPSGAFLGQLTEGNGEPISETCGVTVDEDGSVYVGTFGAVYKYVPTGAAPKNSDYAGAFTNVPQVCVVSAGRGPSAGALFVTSFRGATSKIDASTGEVAYVINEGKSPATTSVDPTTGDVLAADGSNVEEIDASGATPTPVSSVRTESLVEGVASSPGGQLYLTRSKSPTARAGATSVAEYGPFESQAPLIEGARVQSVFGGEAIAAARIGAEGSATTVHVDYGATTAYGLTSSSVSAGDGETTTLVSIRLLGLQPGATYHAKIVATNGLGTSESEDLSFVIPNQAGQAEGCPNAVFRTGSSGRLPDCRAYELVSPLDKAGISIGPSYTLQLTPNQVDQSSLSGDAMTFSSSQAFADAEGASYSPQYLSVRGPQGWETRSISTPQNPTLYSAALRTTLEYFDFTPELCDGVLQNYSPIPLTANAAPGYGNLYKRSLCQGGDPLTGLTPKRYERSNPEFFGNAPATGGISEDGRCVTSFPAEAFGSPPESEREGLLENCDGVIRQVALLPEGTEIAGSAAVGTANSAYRTSDFYPFFASAENAMSADGSVIYWTGGTGSEALYVRVNASEEPSALGSGGQCDEPGKACTYPVSKSVEGGNVGSVFEGAATDGSRAYFVPAGGPNQGTLYEYVLASRTVREVAPGVSATRQANGRQFYPVTGISKDGTKVYFVSTTSLGGGAAEGYENLYLYNAQAGAGSDITFIATLGIPDGSIQDGAIKTSRVTPDGRALVFESSARLTSYKNVDPETGERVTEVYDYDADTQGLACVSCNPSGQAPKGIHPVVARQPEPYLEAGAIPYPDTIWHGARAISDDASRVFFESAESLAPGDTNGEVDVYEWVPVGVGDCAEGLASYSPVDAGCVSLISGGESLEGSELLDSTPDGRNVFFSTGQSLLPQDPGLVDIYDARVDGGFPPPPAAPSGCEGEACQGPISPPPSPAVSSANYVGPGNAEHKKKGKHPKKHSSRKARHKKRHVSGHHKHRKGGKHRVSRHGKGSK